MSSSSNDPVAPPPQGPFPPYGPPVYAQSMPYDQQRPVSRPATLIIASVLTWIGFGLPMVPAVFYVVLGGPALVSDLDGDELGDEFATAFALLGLAVALLCALSIVFSVFAFKGKRWATICLTIEGGLFLILCIAGLIASSGPSDTPLGLVVMLWIGAALALYWVKPSQIYYRSKR